MHYPCFHPKGSIMGGILAIYKIIHRPPNSSSFDSILKKMKCKSEGIISIPIYGERKGNGHFYNHTNRSSITNVLEAPFYLTKMLGEITDQPVKLTCLALDQSGRNENVKMDE